MTILRSTWARSSESGSPGQGPIPPRSVRHAGRPPSYRSPDRSPFRVLVPGMEALEDLEDLFPILGLYPDPIIAHAEKPFLPTVHAIHLDSGRILSLELQGIADEVLEQLDHLRNIPKDLG